MGKILRGLRRELKKVDAKGIISALVAFHDPSRPYVATERGIEMCEKTLHEIAETLGELPTFTMFYPNLQALYIIASARFIRTLAKHRTVLWIDVVPKHRLRKKGRYIRKCRKVRV